jgi:hypothetical protein
MKLAVQKQVGGVTDTTRAKFAMVRPILTATLHSLAGDRIAKLGGRDKVTLEDLAREFIEGSGDCGICFEYAVHDGLVKKSAHVHPRVSEVLEEFCGINGGAESILFGLEKGEALKLVAGARLTDDSRILVGGKGQPPKLKKHMAALEKAFHDVGHRELLPQSIRGLWKADLIVGSTTSDQWVATTLKINQTDLEADAGIRIGIYPDRTGGTEGPRWNEDKNLILCPLSYDGAFMELFYQSFFIVKAVLKTRKADMPAPWQLPASDDRFVAQELVKRRTYTVMQIVEAFETFAQPELLEESFAGDVATPTTAAVAPVAATTK